jgi:hypothetical protein
MTTRTLFTGFAAAALAALAIPAAATPTCTAPARLIQFPTGSPVWEFCLLTPSQSSGNDGSGIEIRDAYYNGHKVFKRAHNPVLNVKYNSGSPCNCYRDWIDQEQHFQIVTAISNPNPLNCPTPECPNAAGNYAESIVPVVTVCSNGGQNGDVPPGQSGFTGVAGERLSDRLILTTQLAAGWYRYYISWTFYTDGKIEPRFGFGALNNSCVNCCGHRHHAYWRFDFDIDDPSNDHIGSPPYGATPRPVIAQENMRNLPDATKIPPFAVYDTVSLRGYQVIPGQENIDSPVGSPPSTGGPFWQGVQYPFDVTDAFMLKYHESGGVPLEINDNVGLGQCALTTTFLDFDNNEMLNNNGDVVLWYRGGGFHASGALSSCAVVGPTLVPLGDWSP